MLKKKSLTPTHLTGVRKPIIWRAVPWFASVSKFRQDILDEIEKVKFHSEWGKVRLYNMIRDRGDWVISRQRAWGVPLPIFYAEDGTPIMTAETIEHVRNSLKNMVRSSGGSVKRKTSCQKDLRIQVHQMANLQKKQISWTSGLTQVHHGMGLLLTVQNSNTQLIFTLKGFRPVPWLVQLISYHICGEPWCRTIQTNLISRFCFDGKGEKMSKSLGNTIAPSDVEKQFGAEILRLWATSVDSSNDVRISMIS